MRLFPRWSLCSLKCLRACNYSSVSPGLTEYTTSVSIFSPIYLHNRRAVSGKAARLLFYPLVLLSMPYISSGCKLQCYLCRWNTSCRYYLWSLAVSSRQKMVGEFKAPCPQFLHTHKTVRNSCDRNLQWPSETTTVILSVSPFTSNLYKLLLHIKIRDISIKDQTIWYSQVTCFFEMLLTSY